MSDPREQVKLLSEALKGRDHTIAIQKKQIEDLKDFGDKCVSDNNKLFEEIERQSHLILVLIHTLGPKVRISVSNFSQIFNQATVCGNRGLSDDDVYTVDMEVIYPETQTKKTDEH